MIYQQLEGWSWPTCGLGGWGGSGRWLLPWWRGGEFLFPLTLCWWAPLDSYWLLLVLLASTLVMLVAPISPFALPSNGAKSEWSEHVVQVGGKTADKGAVFTVSNGQLPGERGSGGWAFQPLFHRGEDSIRIHRSFAILGQTFVGEEEPKGALLNNFTNEDKQVGSFWTGNYRIFLYSYMESKTCVCMERENPSEKFVQENAGTGGDSITSTLVDYPINLSYLSSCMS